MNELKQITSRFIQLYDDALKGINLHTLMGIEQEFQLLFHPGFAPQGLRQATSEAASIQKLFKEKPDLIAKRLKNPLNPYPAIHPGPVERFYFERPDAGSNALEQFEVTTTPTTPLRCAMRIEGLRNYLSSHVPGHQKFDDSRESWLVKAVRFPAQVAAGGQPYGLHVNVSLNYKPKESEKLIPLLNPKCADNKDEDRIVNAAIRALQRVSESDMLLVAPTAQAFERVNAGFIGDIAQRKPFISNHDAVVSGIEPSKYRVEYRLPSGNADPHLAVLTALSAMHQQFGHTAPYAQEEAEGFLRLSPAFREQLDISGRAIFQDEINLSKTLGEARDRFAQRSTVVASMKKLAAEHGTAQDVADAERFTELMLQHSRAQELLERTATSGHSR